MKPSKPVRKYLAEWAEPEAGLAGEIDGSWRDVLAIPASAEDASFLSGLRPAVDRATLVIVVVNGRETAPARVHAANAELVESLRRFGRIVREWPGAFLATGSPHDLLVLDRAREGARLPAREGVGRARKIGADVALALRAAGKIGSEWIHASDADAVQPADRFDAAETAGVPGVAAVVHPFVHTSSGDAALDDALRRYDRSLRYWVAGLRWAGSPYAFPTIGSAVTVRAEHYARVRGFPDRQAGEDFWLLNKLAKVGAVAPAGGGAVELPGRVSDRVPFGTGAAVRRILEADARGEPFRTYDPACFRRLREWLSAAERWAREGTDPFDGLAADLVAVIDPEPVRHRLARLRAQHRADLLRAFHTWFDGFRTVKLIHALRDRGSPDVPLGEAIGRAPFFTPLAGQ